MKQQTHRHHGAIDPVAETQVARDVEVSAALAEVKHQSDSLSPILDAARKGTVILLYSSNDSEHNNAVALREYLQHGIDVADTA